MVAKDRSDADETAIGTWDGWTSRSVEDTEQAGEALARGLRPGDVIALTGSLGAGKTRLAAGIIRGLECEGEVRSPSYTLIHEHPGPVPVAHADLYRLDPAEVETLGLEEQLERGALVVEWGEKLPPRFLEEGLRLSFEMRPGTERMICARLDTARGRGVELLEEWKRAVGSIARSLAVGAGDRQPSGPERKP